jgi:NADH-quinone oxidoreductase subunit C
MQFEEIKSLVEKEIHGAVQDQDLDATPKALIISSEHIFRVCELLHSNEKTYFDSLSSLTALDNGEEKNSVEVIYNLYSIPYDLHLMLKVLLDRTKPEVESVTDIWKTADWHEREAYDLIGMKFKNHPDLRRILLPDDWEGHPLRKDYVEQERYHDVKVKY